MIADLHFGSRARLNCVRRITALQVGLALLLSFYVSPYQHVHLPADHHSESGFGEARRVVVHTHIYPVALIHTPPGHEKQFAADDDDHSMAQSLDTFSVITGDDVPPTVLTRIPMPLQRPSSSFQGVEIVEERGHDPPPLRFSPPRAPPA